MVLLGRQQVNNSSSQERTCSQISQPRWWIQSTSSHFRLCFIFSFGLFMSWCNSIVLHCKIIQNLTQDRKYKQDAHKLVLTCLLHIRKSVRKWYSIIKHYKLNNIYNNHHSDIPNDKAIFDMLVLVNLTISASFTGSLILVFNCNSI